MHFNSQIFTGVKIHHFLLLKSSSTLPLFYYRPLTIDRKFFSTFTTYHQSMSNKENPITNKHRSENSPEHSDTSPEHSHAEHSHTSPEHSHGEHSHAEHSHSHTHSGSILHHHHSMHEPNVFLQANASSVKTNPAVRITWLGLLVNISLAISKGIGGVYFHSQALIADAIHSVSDMLADFLTLATVNVASKIGTCTKFPLGYGKIETIGSFAISAILLFAGISVGWSSMLQVFEFFLPAQLYEIAASIQIGHTHAHTQIGRGNETANAHDHLHNHLQTTPINTELTTHREIPNINAAWLAAGSIVIKEILYRKTMKIATETNSKVLVANAWHHRVDSLTAVVALLTVAGGVLFNVAWLDSIGGIGVSILIIKAGWDTMKEAWYELIDRGEQPGSELYDKVENIVKHQLENNHELNQFKLKSLAVLSSGANTNINFTLITENKSIDLLTLNKYETILKNLIKDDDKFVRNVFITFEVTPQEEKVESEEKNEEKH